MCGIAGLYGPGVSRYAGVVRAAVGRLEHRGPDGEGFADHDNAVLGMRRLAIIDLATGDQPFSNERGDVHVVANGEIYNYVELTTELRARGHHFRSRSDVETVVHTYEDHGAEAFARFRGMFAIAIYDERTEALVLARDPFGQKPLYYFEGPHGTVAFASELKALVPLVRALGHEPKVDDQAVYDFLSLGVIPQPFTIYEGIKSVLAGERIVFDAQGLRAQRYWRPPPVARERISYRDAMEVVREAVAESVRLTLRSDVPIAAFLSGGLDSSIVVAEAVRAGAQDLLTFSVSMDDGTLDEAPVASRTAAALGVENVRVPARIDPVADLHAVVAAYDQPFSDSSALAAFAVSRATAGRRKVVLTGDGGDEIFGGYRRHVAAWLAGAVPRGVARGVTSITTRNASGRASGRRRSLGGFAARFARGLGLEKGERYLVWTQDMLRDVDKRGFGPHEMRATEEFIAAAIGDATSVIGEQFAGDRAVTLPSDLLVKMDIATSAWSLESRAPLLDHVLAERVATLPHRYLFRGGRTKAVLRDAYADVLPREVVRGAKRGFEIPLAGWLEGAWAPLVQDLLLGSAPPRMAAYVPQATIRAAFDGSAFADRNQAYVRYAFLVLELWLRSTDRDSSVTFDG